MEAQRTAPTRESLKETIDSVVVAFILAFVFRAFIVEAFVIPTGSMAPTLYGRHGTITCEECGWEFAYGLADQSGQSGNPIHRGVGPKSQALCQNCGYANTNLKVHDQAGRRGNAEAGDRILVLKWLFDLGRQHLGPQRWDVTVFKDPGPGGQNFIKRLVGLPNEVLEIIDGDVYTAAVAELSPEALSALDRLRHVKYLQRSEVPERPSREQLAQLTADDALLRGELDQVLQIRRKTSAAQESLWTVVYDHDYPPRRLGPGQPHWAPGTTGPSVWDTSDRKIRCRSVGGQTEFLRFAGKPIDDMCSYNASLIGKQPWSPVSDVRLEFVLVPRGGKGRLGLALSKYADTFWVMIGADGGIALYRTQGALPGEHDEPLCERRLRPLPPDEPIEVALQNVDYRVSVMINGREVLATTDEQYAADPTRPGARRPRSSAGPRMWAADLDAELWHVVLRRDVYYTSLGAEQRSPSAVRTGWGTQGHPIWLREGEYFMLGDNSAASKDSRLWSVPGKELQARGEAYQRGTVPGDQLIGRAFFVYWPSGHRTKLLPFLSNWGVIPNVGRMRWIR